MLSLSKIIKKTRKLTSKIVIPNKYAPMTQLIIVINILVFILQILIPVLTEAAVFRSNVWYSYLSACFLHGSVRHILGNMLILSFIAPVVEEYYGSFKLFIVYTLTGIFGSMLMAFYLPQAQALGASGSVSGIMMVWLFINILKGRVFVILPALMYIQFEGVFSGLSLIRSDGIGHLAHFGSAIFALLLAAAFSTKKVK